MGKNLEINSELEKYIVNEIYPAERGFVMPAH